MAYPILLMKIKSFRYIVACAGSRSKAWPGHRHFRRGCQGCPQKAGYHAHGIV